MKHYICIVLRHSIIYLKSCGTALKEAPPAAARGNFAHCCHGTGEYRAMRNGPCTPISGPPKMRKLWLIREATQYLGKMIEETVGEKKEGPLTQSTT